ncbi:MAG: hypothetical protein WKF36_06540 [Candidatus Nitrosocosmicus sp.]
MYGSQKTKIFLGSNSVKGLAEYRAFQTRLDPSITHMEAFEVMRMTLNSEFTVLNTQRPKEDLQTSRKVIEFLL